MAINILNRNYYSNTDTWLRVLMCTLLHNLNYKKNSFALLLHKVFIRMHYTFEIPMTPQARRPPALPVVLLSSWPPLPKSSISAWT